MLLTLTLSTVFAAPTDTDTNPMADQYQEVAFVIAASEKTYSQAVLKAATLSEQSGIEYRTNGVNFDPKHKDNNGGLTYSPQPATTITGVIRATSLEGDGMKVLTSPSEYSSAIQGFTPGLYVVIAASGNKAELQPSLNTVKHFVSDAYMKTSSVYIGCMQ